ncbi:DNA ligase [Angomonas deanei]|uniref:Uncharacterized protein n=1 Tax=Angomonas deanei TaxID=59799 RepID=A0A7G2CWL1_9TRYP|nr:DNA ligase [Angomonas deanei]CAD2222823.1 hypothetical protein, conserved [Angomonas deanei]|eukprot:EPY36211.1 DNA ligase [Angomonas deanei]
MFRRGRLLFSALPFEPMALITVDKLEGKLKSYDIPNNNTIPMNTHHEAIKRTFLSIPSSKVEKTKKTIVQEQLQWFDGRCPLFVSPKHDGVRLISYVNPPSILKNENETTKKGGNKKNKVKKSTSDNKNSCYSRYGRPINGLFWIERELLLLRTLCRDNYLCLDGELYIHREVLEDEKEKINVKNKKACKSAFFKRKVVSTTKRNKDVNNEEETNNTEKDVFKTGFLAVSALVHRLRSTKSVLNTKEDVFQYVRELPRYCIFDIPSFSPGSNTLPLPQQQHTAEEGGGELVIAVHRECARVWETCCRRHGIEEGEELRVLPNVTPFTQRLRTMDFLASLLQEGLASPVLCHYFQLDPPETHFHSNNSNVMPYRGGHFVRMIPYYVIHTIKEAKEDFLPRCMQLNYEGAVMRSAMNVYEMREKKKGTVRDLCSSSLYYLLDQPSSNNNEEEKEALVEHVAEAVRRLSFLSPRANTAIKLLPFRDKEYTILRPLFKEPSINPKTRPLLSLTLKESGVTLADVKPDLVSPSLHDSMEEKMESIRQQHKNNPKKAEREIKKMLDDVMVNFYGVQCMTEEGRVFSVTLPKTSLTQQKELLRHILSKSKKRRRPALKNKASEEDNTPTAGGSALTGLQATVQFASLTEHGVPRFAQIKSIRGGKGWFL